MNRLRGVGPTQQLQGLSVRLDGWGESLLRGVGGTQQLQGLSIPLLMGGMNRLRGVPYTAATRLIKDLMGWGESGLLRGVGGTQQLQGLSMRLDGRGESSERSQEIHSSCVQDDLSVSDLMGGMNPLRGVAECTQQLQGVSVSLRLDGRGDLTLSEWEVHPSYKVYQ